MLALTASLVSGVAADSPWGRGGPGHLVYWEGSVVERRSVTPRTVPRGYGSGVSLPTTSKKFFFWCGATLFLSELGVHLFIAGFLVGLGCSGAERENSGLGPPWNRTFGKE